MSFIKTLIWVAAIILTAWLLYAALTYQPKSDFQESWTCSRVDAFFNITPEEYNCPLNKCKKINELPEVNECDCETTGTKIYTYCKVQLKQRDYIGDMDLLRKDVLSNNQQIINSINETYNPNIKLNYLTG